MASDWVPALITAAVGVTGIGFTWLGSHQARRTSLQLAEQERQERQGRERIEFYGQLVAAARRMQRASVTWTDHPNQRSAELFDEALDAYGLEVAQARVTEPDDVVEAAVGLEETYRTHRWDSNPQQLPDVEAFRLQPLLDVLRRTETSSRDTRGGR